MPGIEREKGHIIKLCRMLAKWAQYGGSGFT